VVVGREASALREGARCIDEVHVSKIDNIKKIRNIREDIVASQEPGGEQTGKRSWMGQRAERAVNGEKWAAREEQRGNNVEHQG
jgi:hypothetical protein